MDFHWIRNSQYDLAKLRKACKGVAVIPLASIESHGPHLPLGNDILALETIVERVIAKEAVAVLPTLSYSSVVEARMLPGAIHIPTDVLVSYVAAICDEAYRNGFDKIVLLHGHGGNYCLHQGFMKKVLEEEKPYAVYSIPVFGDKGPEIKAMCNSETDHACEEETSISLASHPEFVWLKRLGKKTFPGKARPDVGAAATPVDWTAMHPEMVVGRPQLATRGKGEEMLAIWEQEVVSILRKIKKDNLTIASLRDYTKRANQCRGKRNA